MAVNVPTQPGQDTVKRGGLSERARAERKLGWMLCAPAVVAMLLVTAYPIGYAIVLSLQEKDLRFPDQGGFVGLDNYVTVLTSDAWWSAFFFTAFVAVVGSVRPLFPRSAMTASTPWPEAIMPGSGKASRIRSGMSSAGSR